MRRGKLAVCFHVFEWYFWLLMSHWGCFPHPAICLLSLGSHPKTILIQNPLTYLERFGCLIELKHSLRISSDHSLINPSLNQPILSFLYSKLNWLLNSIKIHRKTNKIVHNIDQSLKNDTAILGHSWDDGVNWTLRWISQSDKQLREGSNWSDSCLEPQDILSFHYGRCTLILENV